MASPSPYRDRDVRLAIASILEATHEFDGVYVKSLSEVPSQRAGDARAVSIEPDTMDFSDDWGGGPTDSTDPPPLIVSARLRLTFMTRLDDPSARDDEAERLANVAANALNGQSLAGLTLPAFSRFESLKWLPPEPPERRVSATFVYRYIVDSWTSFDTVA
jgi:hypothetical protein